MLLVGGIIDQIVELVRVRFEIEEETRQSLEVDVFVTPPTDNPDHALVIAQPERGAFFALPRASQVKFGIIFLPPVFRLPVLRILALRILALRILALRILAFRILAFRILAPAKAA